MKHNPRRILGHLKRLMREGDEMLHERPFDEIAHAKWCDPDLLSRRVAVTQRLMACL